MLTNVILNQIAEEENLIGNDRSFFMRVWNSNTSVYENKLKAWGFENHSHVLDAGSGFGQWASALAKLNRKVTAIEFNKTRVSVSKRIFSQLKINNCSQIEGSIENIPFENNSFDAVFAYSSILCTDYRKTLKEFFRVLSPGGKLYFNTNGLGWYLYNLIDEHNSDDKFSARKMAIDTLKNSFQYYTKMIHEPGQPILMTKEICMEDLKSLGFKVAAHGPEGTLSISENLKNTPFFKGEYYGEEGVFEILAEKSKLP